MAEKTVEQRCYEALKARGVTFAAAESCTGGLIAKRITDVPGASGVFMGGIVSYTNEIKEKLLGVSHEVLEEQTAVCEEVAMEMVKGACDALGVDYAISATGVAGPTGGTPEIPTGTIWLGYGSKDDVRTFCLTEDYGRGVNLNIAVKKALNLFIEYLNEQEKQ